MSVALIVLAVVVCGGLLIGIYAISVYNTLVRQRNEAEEAFKTIDVFLKQRYDLIPNVVNTVKGYAQHESGTLEKVIQARNVAMAAGGHDGGMAEAGLATALKSVFALAEQYPDLKANTEFSKLQDTLTQIEEGIQRARRYYNATARAMNDAVQTFPNNIIAGMFNFKAMDYFNVDEASKENVVVSFD